MGKRFADSSEKVEYWTAAVELFRQSGLNCTEFCNREGLSYSTFCRWRDKLWRRPGVEELSHGGTKPSSESLSPADISSAGGKSESVSPSEVSSDGGKSNDEAKFVSAGVVELGRTPPSAGVEVSFSSGAKISVQKDFDRKVFRDVVAILGAELC